MRPRSLQSATKNIACERADRGNVRSWVDVFLEGFVRASVMMNIADGMWIKSKQHDSRTAAAPRDPPVTRDGPIKKGQERIGPAFPTSYSLLDRFFSSAQTQASDLEGPRQRPRIVTDDSDATLSAEQRISAELLSEDAESEEVTCSTRIQHTQAVSCPSEVIASPASMFLSAFNPTPSVSSDEVVAGYTLGEIIGYGGFSIIRRAYSTSGGAVAVKIVRHSDLLGQGKVPLARKRLEHEAEVWASLSHEHVLPLFSTAHKPTADYFFMLYCPAGSLFDILKREERLPQDEAGMMFRQVVRGLRYLHEVAMYVHRDMKLENVLVDDMGTCRIGDFGMAKRIGEGENAVETDDEHEASNTGIHRAVSFAEKVHSFQPGSLPYAAPELLSTLPCLSDPSQDIWALGIMLFALLTGKLPFVDSFEPRLQIKIRHSDINFPSDVGRSTERVLRGCLDRNVSSRWTISMVDEVAWGVGGGSEGDDIAPPEIDDDVSAHRSSPTTPQSHSRPRSADVPDWEHEDRPTRPSMSTAARRSTSRARRSLTRAPVLTDMGSMERSISRHAVPGLDSSIISLQSSSSIASSPPSSASHSLERGRGLQKRSPFVTSVSRSNSPCILPTTPSDYNMPSMLPISELERQSSRGRKHYTDNIRDPLLSPTSELDAADEWDTLEPRSSFVKEVFPVSNASKRAESSPPTSTKWADVIHTKFESPTGFYSVFDTEWCSQQKYGTKTLRRRGYLGDVFLILNCGS
ncbi:kinase-like domain-containing protein [Armillaria mellea]|nr:kinase-like domain-containing protein [Armillaria mellea]